MLHTAGSVSDGILDKRLILVGGKGGVGRSAMSSAIALACARRGRKTLLFEANANDRFGAWFDRPPVGSSIVQLADNLHAVNTNPGTALEEYGMISTFGGRTESPAVDEDGLFITGVAFGWGDNAQGQHRCFSFDKATGELRWTSNTGGRPVDAPYGMPRKIEMPR